jgi:hypothetical protein
VLVSVLIYIAKLGKLRKFLKGEMGGIYRKIGLNHLVNLVIILERVNASNKIIFVMSLYEFIFNLYKFSNNDIIIY